MIEIEGKKYIDYNVYMMGRRVGAVMGVILGFGIGFVVAIFFF